MKKSDNGNLLIKLSRIPLNNDGVSEKESMLIQYIDRSIEEYDFLDIKTLIQLKRIFLILNIDKNDKNIIQFKELTNY